MEIYLRAETYQNECRSPLAPEDVSKLIKNGFTVLVEKSNKRVFSDSEYKNAGAVLTSDTWFQQGPCTLIVGLKELANLDKLQNHTHIYFSHSFKKQKESKYIIDAFKKTESTIYDLEYFRKSNGTRSLAFGFYAGLVGAILGLKQLYNRNNKLDDIENLQPWSSIDKMYEFCIVSPCFIAVIGNGRCSKGVQQVLQRFNINYDLIDKEQTVVPYNYDIIFNCITLDETYNKVWLSPEYTHKKPLLVVDISCDYTKHNNPIKIYSEATNWIKPVFNYNKYISVIAIENLPSLLPRESSTEFSHLLTDLILNYGNCEWANCREQFINAKKTD